MTLSPALAFRRQARLRAGAGRGGLAQTARDVDVRTPSASVDAPGAVAACRAAGAAGVAVMGAVARAGDPGASSRR
ncbi:MAG: hypothetical protein U0470_01155 [Anaerolineae bacterium]